MTPIATSRLEILFMIICFLLESGVIEKHEIIDKFDTLYSFPDDELVNLFKESHHMIVSYRAINSYRNPN